ncbi:hypothetical protein I552_1718 [Mycobacterium xenopi 3993]|nr:hypothetical protein I552_1718 [Mycobacterium xenopi 3993]
MVWNCWVIGGSGVVGARRMMRVRGSSCCDDAPARLRRCRRLVLSSQSLSAVGRWVAIQVIQNWSCPTQPSGPS